MNVEAFLNQVVVVTLYDGNSHQGILRKVGTNPETDEEYVEVKEETGTNFVPVNEIMRIDSAVLH